MFELFNQCSNHINPPSPIKCDNLAVFNVSQTSLLLDIDFETIGKFSVHKKMKQFLLIMVNLVCFEGSFLLRLKPIAVDNNVSDSIEAAVVVPAKGFAQLLFLSLQH